MGSYRELVAWRRAMDLVESIYAIVQVLPVEEKFGLCSQLRRASVSIPSNLAEGHARETPREFARFIAVARGSLAELESQLELVARLRLADDQKIQQILANCDELGRILRGLRNSLSLPEHPRRSALSTRNS